jgi:Uma2 family endonuclease
LERGRWPWMTRACAMLGPMVVAARRPHYSFREYVTVADEANVKLEFVDGEICAMAGRLPVHTAPKVLVEVLSPSTEDYDRGEKLANYKRLGGLSVVVLVAWDRPELEVWDRDAATRWTRRVVTSGTIELASVRCTLDVDAVYHDELGGSLIVSKPM